MTEAFRVCAIVPTHDHWRALPDIVATLRDHGLTVFVMDDGSHEPPATSIGALHRPADGVHVHRDPINRGKGAAVTAGMRLAWEAGFTHAVQVDADGQHDLNALSALLDRARTHPRSLISAQPIFDSSAPLGRRIGRWVTHVWVWIETLSLRITDSMCGFRVYPLEPVEMLLRRHSVGQRMDFDTEIMVRLFWAGTDVEMVPVRVIYPPDNTSNFRLLADNWRISVMHTRLVLAMPRHALACLFAWTCGRRAERGPMPGSARHWSRLAERGAWWGLWLSGHACRLLGRSGCLVVLAPAVLYFLLAGSDQRHASRDFLARARGRPASFLDIYRHFMSFAARGVDGFRAWSGAISPGSVTTVTPDTLRALATDRAGALLVVSHLGNVDLARALLDDAARARLTILVHTRHAVHYNRLLATIRPEAALNLIEVTDIGPETAIDLRQRIDRGEWVVIAGDRTPVTGADHVSVVPFLGAEAGFPDGPWILAALLRCPVLLLFCLRQDNGWVLTVERFAETIELPRRDRRDALRRHASAYASRLEAYARAFPLQWFNFYDFWAR